MGGRPATSEGAGPSEHLDLDTSSVAVILNSSHRTLLFKSLNAFSGLLNGLNEIWMAKGTGEPCQSGPQRGPACMCHQLGRDQGRFTVSEALILGPRSQGSWEVLGAPGVGLEWRPCRLSIKDLPQPLSHTPCPPIIASHSLQHHPSVLPALNSV